MIRQIMIQAPRLIFISEYDRQSWVKGSAGDVIFNFVDLNTFISETDGVLVRQRMNLKPEEKVILFLGGNAAANGISILLKALGLLQIQLSNFICLMPGTEPKPAASWPGKAARKVLPLVGSGTLTQKMEYEIRVHGVADRVRLLPFAKNVPELLAACDVLVFPATQPHFARPVIEAAAMGKPSVGSDLGGVNELIEHNCTGLLVKPGSSSALAAALKVLLTSPEKLKAFGENAYSKAQRDFDAIKQVAKIVKIYDSILGAGDR
jgi:glycosyltransferase involved in cell wall biosynthesis